MACLKNIAFNVQLNAYNPDQDPTIITFSRVCV